MLISIDSDKIATKVPHKKDFDRWRKNISDEDYEKVVDALNEKIDASDIHVASWIPGHDWTGTVYEPLYYACGKNVVQAGFFFGLILFKILMERTDYLWGFIRTEINGVAIKSMVYFLTQKDPKDYM